MKATQHWTVENEDGTLSIMGECPITGQEWVLNGINPEKYDAWVNREILIQDAFPGLSAGEREMLMTGITPDGWNKMCAPYDEDQEDD